MATTIPNVIDAYDMLYWALRALDANTTYAVGTFGSSLDYKGNLERITRTGWNEEHKAQITEDAKGGNCFAFDCIGLVKGTGWWGWEGDPSMRYGGAAYKGNRMADVSVHAFFRDLCYPRQPIKKGSMVPIGTYCGLNDWSHIAISIGNNVVVEATRYGTHNVRLARIEGLPTLGIYQKLPVRSFDFFAYCKYVDFDEVWIARDASGFETLIRRDDITGVEEPTVWYGPITLEAPKIITK